MIESNGCAQAVSKGQGRATGSFGNVVPLLLCGNALTMGVPRNKEKVEDTSVQMRVARSSCVNHRGRLDRYLVINAGQRSSTGVLVRREPQASDALG